MRVLALFASLLPLGAASAIESCNVGSVAGGICRETLDELAAGAIGVELLQAKAGKTGSNGAASALSVEAIKEDSNQGGKVTATAAVEVNATAAGNTTQASQQIPGLGGVIGNVGNAVSGAVGGARDAVSGAVGGARSAVSGAVGGARAAVGSAIDSVPDAVINNAVTSALADAAARQMVGALNGTLNSVASQVDILLNEAATYRATALQKVAAANATVRAKAAVLEKQVNETVGAYLPEWKVVTSSFNTTVNVVVQALGVAGQQSAADKIKTVLGAAMEQANVLTDMLESTSAIMANASNMVNEDIAKQLTLLNQTLEDGLDEADKYRSSLDESFGNMLDEAADALAQVVGSNATLLRQTFDGLQVTEANVSKSLMASVGVLLSGLGEATTATEALLAKGGASHASCLLAFGMAAIAALIAA